KKMSDENWNTGLAKSLGIYLNGQALRSPGPSGEKITDDHFYIIFNADSKPVCYELPEEKYACKWIRLLDTASSIIDHGEEYLPKGKVTVNERSVVLLTCPL